MQKWKKKLTSLQPTTQYHAKKKFVIYIQGNAKIEQNFYSISHLARRDDTIVVRTADNRVVTILMAVVNNDEYISLHCPITMPSRWLMEEKLCCELLASAYGYLDIIVQHWSSVWAKPYSISSSCRLSAYRYKINLKPKICISFNPSFRQ